MVKLSPDSAWEFAETIKGLFGQLPIKRNATVQQVDPDGTIWVQLPGSSKITPIKSTGANVAPGDVVLTELRGTNLCITENRTDPAVGSNAARAIAQAITAPAIKAAEIAKGIADEARQVADATGQHFWDDDNGAHVTDVTREEWETAVDDGFSDYDPSAKPYHNQLTNSLGILLRTALNNLVSITRSAIAFYDGTGNSASNIVARFGSDGAQVGASGSGHIGITPDELQIVNSDNAPMFDVDMDVGTAYATTWTDSASASNRMAIGETGTFTVISQQHAAAINGAAQGEVIKIPSGTQVGEIDVDLLDESASFTESQATANGLRIAWNGRTAGAATTFYIRFYTSRDVQWTYGTASNQTLSITGLKATGGGFSSVLIGLTLQISYDGGGSFTSTITGTVNATKTGTLRLYVSSTVISPKAGYTRQTSGAAFTFGTRSEGEIGSFSSTMGEGLIASTEHQAVFGSFNVADTNDEYAMIIGNGTSDSARSNAGALKKDGTLELAEPVPIASGGTGATTAIRARTMLGIGNAAVHDVVPVANGGTGIYNFGTRTSKTGDMTSVANNTWTQIAYLQLLTGTWLVYANGYAAAHSSGYNQFRVTTGSSVSNAGMGSSISFPGTSVLYAPLPITVVTASSSANIVRVFAWQNSGGDVNMRAEIRVMKIG